MFKRILLTTCILISAAFVVGARPAAPDMEAIKAASTDPHSQYYYPKLLKMFLSNDTVMTDEDYKYFYYGTMFQEDYNPYRQSKYQEEAKDIEPLYLKKEHLTRAERKKIEDFARKSLEDNPLELRQLMHRVYVYEQNQKLNLAKIWKHKFNKILMTIAKSGDGSTPETAWVVVYPRHEFDFFNLSGGSVTKQEFQEPYYDKLTVSNLKGDKSTEYYFNLHMLLEQYYLKHPDER